MLFVGLASDPTQTKQDCDRNFAVVSKSLFSVPVLDLDLEGGESLLTPRPRMARQDATTQGLQVEGPQRARGARAPALCTVGFRTSIRSGQNLASPGLLGALVERPANPQRAGVDDPVVCVWCKVEEVLQALAL